MEFKPYTIFRVVGNHPRSKNFNEYAILTYLVIKETPRYYTVSKDGEFGIRQKRNTSNSEWFHDIDEALKSIESRITKTLLCIQESIEMVKSMSFVGIPYTQRLYIANFHNERFFLKCYHIIKKTGKAWFVDTGKTKLVYSKQLKKEIEKPVGRAYIYPRISLPHNYECPYEKWIGKDLDVIKQLMTLYAEDRQRHLRESLQKIREWVRLFKKEREIIDDR